MYQPIQFNLSILQRVQNCLIKGNNNAKKATFEGNTLSSFAKERLLTKMGHYQGKWEVLGQNEKVGIFESAVEVTLGKPGRHLKQVKHLKQVGGDRGFRVSRSLYHVLPPPVVLCPFASRLPPLIVLLLSSG